MFKKFTQILNSFSYTLIENISSIFGKKKKKINITKRQKFAVGVMSLSILLFISELLLGKQAIYIVLFLSVLADLFLLWALRNDLRDNFSLQIFILPFLFTISFGLFYLLVPARFLARIFMTSLYAVGIYSLFLSQNIFVVSSIRTIALLSSARTVSFVITLISFFFLTNVIFTLHLNVILTILFLAIFSLPLILQSIWTYTLDRGIKEDFVWGLLLTLCLSEITLLLWFWPSNPTMIALFLAGFFYIIVGLSHVWFEKRLFKGVLWEYIWVAVVVFTVLVAFTSWT